MNLSNLDGSPKHYGPWEEPIPKVIYHIIPFTEHSWKDKNDKNRKQRSGCEELTKQWGPERIRCGYKRVAWGFFMVMEMFCILSVSWPISWLCSSLARWLLGKLSKGSQEPPCVIYGLHVNQELFQKGSFN